jgi:hypothetical protein
MHQSESRFLLRRTQSPHGGPINRSQPKAMQAEGQGAEANRFSSSGMTRRKGPTIPKLVLGIGLGGDGSRTRLCAEARKVAPVRASMPRRERDHRSLGYRGGARNGGCSWSCSPAMRR